MNKEGSNQYLNKDKLTESMEKFAKNYGQNLMPATTAARAAGYQHPNVDYVKLLKEPKVQARIIEYLRAQAIRWKVLVTGAKKVLQDSLCATKAVYNKAGELVTTVDDTAVRLEAARIILQTLKRDGSRLLEDVADEEDAASKPTIDLAKQILGESTPDPEPPAVN